ncbi:MAG: Fic family protein [Bacteroidetes bacterium]|nr:Fic family protein [Bacteroidota bacterium]
MIDLNEVLSIHQMIMEKFGGSAKVRDMNALKSALNRPFATFDKKDLYPTPIDKAAALIESVVINHPFVDGNKRMGYVLMRLLLLKYKFDIKANQNEKFEFVIRIASGELKIEQITSWLKEHSLGLT